MLEEATRACLIPFPDTSHLEEVRIQYLGKRGVFVEMLKYLGELPEEDREQAGNIINDARKTLQATIEHITHNQIIRPE